MYCGLVRNASAAPSTINWSKDARCDEVATPQRCGPGDDVVHRWLASTHILCYTKTCQLTYATNDKIKTMRMTNAAVVAPRGAVAPGVPGVLSRRSGTSGAVVHATPFYRRDGHGVPVRARLHAGPSAYTRRPLSRDGSQRDTVATPMRIRSCVVHPSTVNADRIDCGCPIPCV